MSFLGGDSFFSCSYENDLFYAFESPVSWTREESGHPCQLRDIIDYLAIFPICSDEFEKKKNFVENYVVDLSI